LQRIAQAASRHFVQPEPTGRLAVGHTRIQHSVMQRQLRGLQLVTDTTSRPRAADGFGLDRLFST
jgi:hypothetical protein